MRLQRPNSHCPTFSYVLTRPHSFVHSYIPIIPSIHPSANPHFHLICFAAFFFLPFPPSLSLPFPSSVRWVWRSGLDPPCSYLHSTSVPHARTPHARLLLLQVPTGGGKQGAPLNSRSVAFHIHSPNPLTLSISIPGAPFHSLLPLLSGFKASGRHILPALVTGPFIPPVCYPSGRHTAHGLPPTTNADTPIRSPSLDEPCPSLYPIHPLSWTIQHQPNSHKQPMFPEESVSMNALFFFHPLHAASLYKRTKIQGSRQQKSG